VFRRKAEKCFRSTILTPLKVLLINFTRTFKVISGKDGLNTLAVDSVTKAGDKNLFCIMGHADAPGISPSADGMRMEMMQ
jgi:hypothetical protein